MGDAWTLGRAREDIERLALRALTRESFFDQAAARLGRAIPFAGACWHTLDPGSDLITQHRLQNLPDRFPVLARNEYAEQDANKFAVLARSPEKACTLAAATGGRPDRSPRHRDLLTPAGLDAELRCSFVADGVCWGSVVLVRRKGEPDFASADVKLLSELSPILARAVRRGLVREAVDADSVPQNAPGLVEFDADGAVAGTSSTAEPLLAELSGTTVADGLRAPALLAVASATAALLTGVGESGAPPMSAVKTSSGTWLMLHGGLLGGSDERRIGVFLQRAHPTLVAPLLLKAFGLTPREDDVAQQILRGAPTTQIARHLRISPYTVTDHLKRIYEKTDTRTRGELSVRLFFDQHLPRIQAHVPVGDDASFADAPRPRGTPGETG